MRITRYLMVQIATAMAFIVVSLTCVIWLSQSLRFVDLIVNRGLPILTFLQLTVMLMPTWLSVVLPIAAFAATVFVYNRLTNDREMVVMSAAGISPTRLARPALLIAVLTTGLCYLMTLYLVPLSYRSFKELQFQIRHNLEFLVLKEGEFRTLGDNITVYVREREEEGQLAGLIVHDDREADKSVTLVAERGILIAGEAAPRVVMEKGSRQERDLDSGQVSILYFDRYTIDLGSLRSNAQRGLRDRNELYLGDLLNPPESVTNPDNFREYIAEGHQRLTSPLLALALTAVGLAVLFSGEFSRRGQAWRIGLAVLLAGGVEAATLGSKFLAIKEPIFLIAMWSAVLIPVAASYHVLTRNRLRRPGPSDTIASEA